MYVEDVEDLYDKARAYVGPRGRCLAYSSEKHYVQLMLYRTHIFYLALGVGPMYTGTLALAHEVTSGVVNNVYFGESLACVENTRECVEAAFDTLDKYARLLLPDKFLEAYDAFSRDNS